jgi:ABC-2 type transport system ATP-binding protein
VAGIVEIENLVKRFGETMPVKGVSFSVQKGSVYGLLGPNGAGKSTIIKILCGVYHPTSGTVKVAGIDVDLKPEKVRRKIGYMSQKFTLYEDLTVRENLSFYADIYGLKGNEKKQRITELMALTNLTDRTEYIVRTLSGGWKQRLALVCALLHNPPLLILDEPTAGVDPVSRKTFWDIIQDLSSQGLSVLVTTHYMDEAELCDVVSIIYDGLFKKSLIVVF